MCKKGRVIKEKDDIVVLSMTANKYCKYCQACKTDETSGDLEVEAYNKCSAKVNDLVIVKSHLSLFRKVVAISCLLPFIILLSGIGIGGFLAYYLGVERIIWMIKEANIYIIILGFLLVLLMAMICNRIINYLYSAWNSRDSILIAKEISNQ